MPKLKKNRQLVAYVTAFFPLFPEYDESLAYVPAEDVDRVSHDTEAFFNERRNHTRTLSGENCLHENDVHYYVERLLGALTPPGFFETFDRFHGDIVFAGSFENGFSYVEIPIQKMWAHDSTKKKPKFYYIQFGLRKGAPYSLQLYAMRKIIKDKKRGKKKKKK